MIAAYVALRAYVNCSGSAMLLCPAQYHTSPKVTSAIVATPVQPPSQRALTVYAPPAACAGSSDFHVPLAASTSAESE